MIKKKEETDSLAHTKWNCKYHIVFAPKYRRQVIYGQIRSDIGVIIRKLCEYKGVEIIEAEACPDHIHMLVSIPPKYSVSQFMGYLKGKNAGLGYVYVYQALIMTLALQMNDGGMVVLEGQEDSFAVMLLLFDKQEEIADFLLQNQKKWSVSSTGRLVITDSNVQREYQRIAKERNELLQRLDG